MKTGIMSKLRGNLAFSSGLVVLSLFGLLAPYSLLLGWNFITLLLFWFILVPIISIVSSRFYNKINKNWIAGIIGCIVFYSFMVFMIYSHYKSDFFKIMILSSLSSIFIIWFVEMAFLRKKRFKYL